MDDRRATQRHRDRTAQRLRHGWLAGAVSTDTFEARLDLALRARRRGQLTALTGDLPTVADGVLRRLRQWLDRPAEVPAVELRLSDVHRSVVLGRSRRCDVVYDDDSVSRRHARLRLEADGWTVRDLGSVNGTWLNGERVEGERELEEGDLLQLGCVLLRITGAA